MTKTKIKRLFERLQQANPHPTTELSFKSNFELLIAVMLSAQATDISVNKATASLYAKANTPSSLLALGLDGLKHHIKSIGLYNSKAQNIISTCQILLDKHCGQVPNTRQELEALPGVGRKTANVVLNTAFGMPTMAVDTHIFRVSLRIGLSSGSNVLKVEQDLLHNIQPQFLDNAHHWLILHGRYVCKARKPNCSNCIIADLCEYQDKNLNIII